MASFEELGELWKHCHLIFSVTDWTEELWENPSSKDLLHAIIRKCNRMKWLTSSKPTSKYFNIDWLLPGFGVRDIFGQAFITALPSQIRKQRLNISSSTLNWSLIKYFDISKQNKTEAWEFYCLHRGLGIYSNKIMRNNEEFKIQSCKTETRRAEASRVSSPV